jgi:hypothetical protein
VSQRRRSRRRRADFCLGCHPSALQSHLAKNDPTIDDDAFVYIYTLLITHPSVRVVLATYPLPTPEGKYLLGTAPLPDDFNPPDATLADVDISAMYREGVRGRQLAYHLAGEEYLTSKQAIEEKKVQQLKARLEGKKLAKGKGKAESRNRDGEETPLVDADEVKTEESDLITYVDTDDGGQGEDKVLKSDLRGLTAKWGSRLRLRCTDEEIYFRLTGSHQKVNTLRSLTRSRADTGRSPRSRPWCSTSSSSLQGRERKASQPLSSAHWSAQVKAPCTTT